MLQSYFFIPANSLSKLKKVNSIKSDYFIFDLEDTISLSQVSNAIENLELLPNRHSNYVRPKLVENEKLYIDVISDLLKLGYKKFVLPKLQSLQMWSDLLDVIVCDDLEIILLVEHPRLLLNLTELLEKHGRLINSIGFGSQDYCTYSGLKHTISNIDKVRFEISWRANAYNIECIDTASMNISNSSLFKKDCQNAFEMGYTGKFLIHPWQLKCLKKTSYYDDEEIRWYNKVIKSIENIKNHDLSAIVVEGQVVEKPHLKKIEQYKKFLKNND